MTSNKTCETCAIKHMLQSDCKLRWNNLYGYCITHPSLEACIEECYRYNEELNCEYWREMKCGCINAT